MPSARKAQYDPKQLYTVDVDAAKWCTVQQLMWSWGAQF